MAGPVAFPQSPQHTPSRQVDQQQVDTAIRTIKGAAMLPGGSAAELADAIRNPLINDAERRLIIQTLARDGGAMQSSVFYPEEVGRGGGYPQGLDADRETIGQALKDAYEHGDITAEDLVRIADSNGMSHDAQRLLEILEAGGGTGPNGTVEALSDALWERNEGNDRAIATLGYMSDPGLTSRNLNTAGKRRAGFEALVAFNGNDKNFDLNARGAAGEIRQTSALDAAGRLFLAHTDELIDFYTGATPGPNGEPRAADTQALARFFSQTVLNPGAQGIALDRTRDLVPAIRSALGNYTSQLLHGARNAKPGSVEQDRYMQQFGLVAASISGASALALSKYDAQIQADEASREQFVGLVGDLVGATKIGGVTGVDKITEMVAGAIWDANHEERARPDSNLADQIKDIYATRIKSLENELDQPGLLDAFNASYASERGTLWETLNVNPGGHED